jgi:hypothetical protein
VIQQEQSLPLGILPRIKDDVAIVAVVALARVLGLDRNRPTELFLPGGDIQSVNALEIFGGGVLARGYDIDGAVRTASAVDDRSGSDADLRTDLAATVVVRRRLARSQYRHLPQQSPGVCIEGLHAVILSHGINDIMRSLARDGDRRKI